MGQAALANQPRARLPKEFGEPHRMTVEIDGGRINTEQGCREPRLARSEIENECRQIAATCRAVPDPLRSLMIVHPLQKTLALRANRSAPNQRH